MTRKICIITGTRAEYGLLRWVIEGVRDHPALSLQLVVTGMHLSPKFGETYREIETDGFTIDRKVDIDLISDLPADLSRSIGLGFTGFGTVFGELEPDLVVVLGDRFEILAAAGAAMMCRIPIAHVHGGEATEGLIDEAIRHAVTKMAHLHFAAAKPYRERIIQLGEQPDRVFLVGGLGIDGITRLQLMERAELEASLDFELAERNLLVTFHPVTLEAASSAEQIAALLDALAALDHTGLIFTMPNADTDGGVLFELIEAFVAGHPRAKAFASLGHLRYLSCMRIADGVVGNSSSGLIEAPSLGRGTLNIGDRQRGRLKARSVIDCTPDQGAIADGLAQLLSADFRQGLANVENPYGSGGASEKIVETLARVPLGDLLKKKFYDIPLP
jgi:GDP/UDP-N,N'-diacetylbacillosamine 2-epimerase (hydrolysing)